MPFKVSQSSAPIAPPRVKRALNLDEVMGRLRLNDIRNDAQNTVPCQLAYTPHAHERTANSHAISRAYDVMQQNRDAVAKAKGKRDGNALDKAIWHLSPRSSDRLGDKILCYLTVLGAVRGGIAFQLDEKPGDEVLSAHLRKLDEAIVRVGVKIGRCKGVPDGAFHGDKETKRLFDEIESAKQVIVDCFHEVGGQEVMGGIAAAILPPAMRDSIADHLPDQASKFAQPDGAPEVKEVLERRSYLALQDLLRTHVENSMAEGLAHAVLHLLKIPEYVVNSEPGRKGDQRESLDHGKPPDDMPQWLRNKADGGSVHYAPVEVKNEFSDLIKVLDKPPFQLSDLRNLLNDAREDAFERGRLTEVVKNQDQYIDRLERRLLETQQRLEKFANGAGGARVSRGTQARPDVLDQGTSAPELPLQNDQSGIKQPAGLAPDEPAPPAPPRGVNAGNGNGVVRADQDTQTEQRNQLDKRNQFDQSTGSARNSQNGEGARYLRRNVDSQGNQKDTRTLGSQGNQNEQADRQIRNASGNQLSPDGRLDDIAHPAAQQQRGHQLQGRDETDHSNSRLQRQQRLGSTQQRLEGQHDERNRRLQDRNDGSRLGNAHAPFVADGPYQEYKHYLNSLKIDVGPLEPDPFAPTSERTYQADRPWDPVNGFSSMRQIMPSDVKEYVKERGENAGTPFVPFMKGKVRPVPVQEDTELQKAFDAFFKKSRLISTDPRNAAAPSVQQSQGEGAVPNARSPGVEAVKPPAPRMFMSRREEELLVPAFVRGGVAEGRRAADVRSPLAPAGTGRALHAPLLPNGPLAETSRPARASGIPALARSVTLPSDNFRNSLLRGRSDSVFSNASSTLNPLTLEAIRGSRIPGATLSRQDSFDGALEAERDDESIIVAADTKWHVSDGVDSGNGSPTGFGSLDSADWDPQTLDRVADRIAVDDKSTFLENLEAVRRDLDQMNLQKLQKIAS
jgi:hypothetical protein